MGADFEDAYKELVGTSSEDLSIVNIADRLGILDRRGSTISTHSDQKCRVHIQLRATLTLPAVDFYVESVSGYDPLKVGRDEPDWILGAECSRWTSELWYRAQGRLARKYPRSWGYFSGSPETAQDWFSEIATLGQGPNDQGIVSYYMPSWANRVLYPGGADDPAIQRLQSSMSRDRFLSRHIGKPSPPRDAVLPEFKHSLHVHPVEYVQGYPVYVFIDPGTKVYAVDFVQIVGMEVRMLNQVYIPRATHSQVINATLLTPEWKYVRAGVIDVAGSQHHFGGGSPEEAWFRDTQGLQLQAKYWRVEQTVERLRSVLQINPVTLRPYLLINPRCTGIISEMGGGKSPNPEGGLWRMSPQGTPRTDNCDATKALGYGLLSVYGTINPYQNEAAAQGEESEEEKKYGGTYMAPVRAKSSLIDALTRRGHA
ncbi:MAG TPA: hypothetical protein ACFYED_00215 [Candidatus Tripitaka californicus]|uniref:hypothetical protein n=1 Tax=Candidatus Tripitaka californicus TaxID=3367616 RepID=UPI0040261EE3